MPLQSLIWTALPNGVTADGKSLRLSVLVSPRLEPDDAPKTLSSFADFASWPSTVGGAKIVVRIGAKSFVLTAANIDRTIGAPDTATWEALFAKETFVRPFAMPDHSEDTVLSFDAVAMHNTIRKIYAKLTAQAGDELPSMLDLLGDKELLPVIGGVVRMDSEFWNRKTRQRDIGKQLDGFRSTDRYKTLGPAAELLAPFQLFHTPPSKQTTQTSTPKDDPRTAVTWRTHERATFDAAKAVLELDFHQIVAAMNQYPTLLRRLGLVMDFVIPNVDVPRAVDVPVSVEVDLPKAATIANASLRVTRRDASPVTRARIAASIFTPLPRPSPIATDVRVADGMLVLDAERFALLQADVDGAGHKLMNFARTLAAHAKPDRAVDPVTKLPRRAGAPALRNAGLMLVQRQRSAALTNAFTRNKTRDAAMKAAFGRSPLPAPQLYAEDLVRGWRVDIWDKTTSAWRSLCERLANYDVGRGAITLQGIREEGSIRLAATTAADPGNAKLVYLHEAVMVWNGWSLAARPPGLTVGPDDKVAAPEASVPDGIRLRSSFVAAPGSLPRLRYGRLYAVRARVVDLASNSLPPSTANYTGDAAAIAKATPYLRFEPLQPPGWALVQVRKKLGQEQVLEEVELPKEGESMARMAIRTLNDRFDDPAATKAVARRWAVATRTSQHEAELHGALDGAAWGTPVQFELLANRDRELAITAIKSTDRAVTQFAVLPDTATQLPYLPDPLATHVAARFVNHPSITFGKTIVIPLYPKDTVWPNAAPIMIRLYEGAGEKPDFDEATRTLRVPTPKGVRATLRMSCMLDVKALELMGVWNWVPAAERTAALRKRAGLGQIWSLTPWREMEIVHAVQRPLLAPAMSSLSLHRPPGSTWVRPAVDAKCHRMTTDRVDLRAAWNDPHDDRAASAPVNLAKADVAFSVKVTDPQGYAGIVEHEIPNAADINRIAFGAVKPGGIVIQSNDAPAKVHDFGDTRYRRVEYQLVASTRFREYMEPALLRKKVGKPGLAQFEVSTDEHITQPGPVSRTWALNAAAPPAPEVRYVVPTFGWTRGTNSDGKRTSWRRGSGLRVWLDRPWNASGYGEMLAVVLPPAGAAIEPNDTPYKHTVTQWGNDPVWRSEYVAGVAPKLADCTLARLAPDPTGAWLPPNVPAVEADQPPQPFQTKNLLHAGMTPGSTIGSVDIAPHDVFWDADRQLWYSDIEIAHGESYFPFIRLAVARYQPSSLPGAHLSNVVITDFSALAPDRWMSVAQVDTRRRQVKVFGHTHFESSGHAEAWPRRTQRIDLKTKKRTIQVPADIAKTNVIEVWLEQLAPNFGEDFGWRRVAEGEPALQMAMLTTTQTATTALRMRKDRARKLVQEHDYQRVVSESLLELTTEWPQLWSGSVVLPREPVGTRFRVVVAEYEEYLADSANAYDGKLEKKGRRLVFVEHVEVS